MRSSLLRRFSAATIAAIAALAPAVTRAAPHAPEPLDLDLVRGLGAKKGELEGNVLVAADPTSKGHAIEWAPELEWAPRDGLALEVELPTHDRRLEAMKLAVQITFARLGSESTAHGLQIAMARGLDDRRRAHALWIRAAARGRFAATTLVGPRIDATSMRRAPKVELVASAAPFVLLPRGVAVGTELGFTGSAAGAEVHALPQLHIPIGRHVKLQVGGGARHRLGSRKVEPTVAVRFVVER